MTLERIFKMASRVDRDIAWLLSESGFHNCFDEDTYVDLFDPEELFLMRELEKALGCLEKAHAAISWMAAPVTGSYRLRKLKSGRYGFLRLDGSLREYSCGDTVEALTEGGTSWAKTRIEHNREDYYLYGEPWERMEGLLVRERGGV